MAREKEKQEKAIELAKKHMPFPFLGLPITECIDTALEMADWADEHPKEGLWDAEKVTNWLRENFENYAYNYGIDEVIAGLTKAMEE